jgi:hypothetical protein
MVNKKRTTSEQKGRVKVGKLKLNKQKVKDLSGNDAKKIKGGLKPTVTGTCIATRFNCI